MRSHSSGHRNRRNLKKRVSQLKRKLHFEDGSVWSWQVTYYIGWADDGQHIDRPIRQVGVRIKSPEGEGVFVPEEAFLTAIEFRTCDSYLNTWCSGHCYKCSPVRAVFAGPGFKPSVVKKYIQDVLIEGKQWEMPCV